MTFDRKILRGVRRQVLYSHHVNCTAVPWGSLSLLVIPLALVNGLHYWPVIKRCLSMFDFSAILTWIDLYLEWRSNEFEDPGSSFIHPGCDIYSGNKDIDMCSRWSSYSKDDNFSRKLSVYLQTIVCHMYQNVFIKSWAWECPPQLDHENIMKIMYCIVSYYRSPSSLKKLQILMINHFTWHQNINDLML